MMSKTDNLEMTKILINSLPKIEKLIYLDAPDILKEYNISKTQFKIILIVGLYNGSIMKEIWQKLNMTKGNLSIMTDVLVHRKCIKRERQLDDRRKTRIFLTQYGQEIHDKIMTEIDEQFDLYLSRLPNLKLEIIEKAFEYLDKMTSIIFSE